ncbi:hypothetical protein F4775DRAFT_538482 [Biscogniauxia sp. FL1348]|nr:hypothetical protein F4775DRAFT_538482 [Biscogniauxia sp. FL1348]
MVSPPWAEASSHEQYFVLLTGANSGVGLGIGQRIIDEFLAERSLSSHLILIPTTRSAKKSSETILALRAYRDKAAQTSKKLRARAGPDYDPRTAVERVHIVSVQLDLCDLRSVYAAADQLVHGKLTDPTGVIEDVAIPRIDAAILNAGIGGWEGIDWLQFLKQFLSVGLVQSTSYPSFKIALPAAVLDQQKLIGEKPSNPEAPPPPPLAEVFCANVFGHYILAHELLPLLSRSSPDEEPGRIIWTSSVDTGREHFDPDDFQATLRNPPYESSKRITDYLALTADLPSVRPISAPYFALSPSSQKPSAPTAAVKPRFYLSHPGIVCTPLFPLNWFLFCGYYFAMLLSRWAGSPWHTVTPYRGACASVWLALADVCSLEAARAHAAKWGSACGRIGPAVPKRTEVDGWGWEGRVEDPRGEEGREDEKGIRAKSRGRRWCAEPMSEEKRAQFEEDGRKCWVELERLRRGWEVALGRRKVEE